MTKTELGDISLLKAIKDQLEHGIEDEYSVVTFDETCAKRKESE